MPECARCEEKMESKGSGFLDALGLASYDGYECRSCGTLICSDCYRQRKVELAGAAHDNCPTCEGRLAKR